MRSVQGSRRDMQISDRRRMESALKFSGALPDPHDVRARVQAEKLECPICFDPIHPDNWNKHMTLKHANSPVALHDSTPGRLALAVIRMDGGTQPRTQIDEAVVSDYVEQMKDGVVFPAVTVFYDGANYWLADGFHRVTAAKQTEATEIQADVKQGTQRDAKLYSFSANATHGLRRTNSDKRRAVEAMLNDNEWSQWSDREIARRCSVGHALVNRMRNELSLKDSSERTYTQQRGDKSYTFTMKTDNIGSKPTLPPTAPAAFHVAVDNGFIGVREAVKSNEVLVKLPAEYHDAIANLTSGDVDKINILQRLHKSMGSPETNGTFDEVMRTGGFHYGDALEKWCDFEADNVESISKALQSVAHNHAVIEAGNSEANRPMKPKINRPGDEYVPQGYDACQTPAHAIDPLLPYLRKDWVIWEPAAGEGLMVEAFFDSGLSVVSSDILTDQNFFEYVPTASWDVLVTNPPYSIKYKWLERCYALEKPFALLLPVETLGAKTGQELFREYGLEVIFLDQRINFKMPNAGWDGGGAQFPVAWFTWGLDIGKEMTFARLKND